MKIGFIFPGQGSQVVGMGKDIYENYESVQEIYEIVKQVTGINIAEISFEGPNEVLNQTKYTQLAILTMSIAITKILEQNGIKAEISAGLSLGEYSALIYSKCLKLEDGIKLVQKRGKYMQDELPKGEWLMAAIIGLNDEAVEQVCKQVKSGFVVPANYNTKGQVVISGEVKAVKEAQEIAKQKGAILVKELKTSGPFHTKKLKLASKLFGEELKNIQFNKFETKVIKNIDATEYKEEDDIKNILEKHIISPVKFSKTLENMIQKGIDTFIEIGPGKTLSGFLRKMKTENKINILNINDIKSLEETINFLKLNNN